MGKARPAWGALALSLLAACGNPTGGLTGTVSADGSSTVFPITEAIGEEFKIANPSVQVVVGTSGTGGGFKKFCEGLIDVSDASRKIKASEKAKCAAAGVEFLEVQVANDGLAIVVNRANRWADCLTTQELAKIWAPGSGVKNWKDVRAGFPDQALKLYGPGTDSGTFDYFTAVVNGEEGASRSDYTASEDDNTLVQGISAQRGALGYFGFAYYFENKEKLRLVGVDGGSGCVRPSDETVKSNEYAPLSRPLFIYVRKASIAKPVIKEFIDFYLENVNLIIEDVGYTALSDEQLKRERSEFDKVAAELVVEATPS